MKRVLQVILLAGFWLSASSFSDLFDRSNGLIYDDDLDITWLQDAGLGGDHTWNDTVDWADALVFGGFDDWRLPSVDVNGDGTVVECSVVSETDCRDNELGYMYYWNLTPAGEIPPTKFGTNLTGFQGPIQNVQPIHWSSTESAPNPGFSWGFFGIGIAGGFDKDLSLAAWAVRRGDVLAGPAHMATDGEPRTVLSPKGEKPRFATRVFPLEIIDAVKKGDLAKVKILFGEDPALIINIKDSSGATLLHLAAVYNRKTVAEALVANGADIDAKRKEGETPLILAASKGHQEMVEMLIANGADVNARESLGYTPLYWAIIGDHWKVAELLIASGAAVDTKSYDGRMPLHAVARKGEKAMAELLIANGADVNSQDNKGITPLHKAGKEMAKLLIAKGADIRRTDGDGNSPLHSASKTGNEEIVELLIAAGADSTSTEADLTTGKSVTVVTRY